MSRIRMQARKRWDYSPVLVPLQAVIYSNTSITGSGDDVYKSLTHIVLNVREGLDQDAFEKQLRGVSRSIKEETTLRQASRCETPHNLEIEGITWSAACVPGFQGTGRAAAFRFSGSEIRAITTPIWSHWDAEKIDRTLSRQVDVYGWTTSGVTEKDLSVLKTILLDGHPGVGIPTIVKEYDRFEISEEVCDEFFAAAATDENVRGARVLYNGPKKKPWFLSYWYYFEDEVVTVLLCKVSPNDWIREWKITRMGSKLPDYYAVEALESLTATTDPPVHLTRVPEDSECILRDCLWKGFIDVSGLQADNTPEEATGELSMASMSESSSDPCEKRAIDEWIRLFDPYKIPKLLTEEFRSHEDRDLHILSKPLFQR